MANPSEVEVFNGSDLKLEDVEIKILDLPGHSVNQKGFMIDGTAFVADTLFPDNFFRKQRLPFTYDPHAHLQTLEKLRNLSARIYVGGHFSPTANIAGMIASNQKHVEEAMAFMRELPKTPLSQDRVVKAFLDHFGLKNKLGILSLPGHRKWLPFIALSTRRGQIQGARQSGGMVCGLRLFLRYLAF